MVVQNSEVMERLAEREKELAQVEELVRSLDEEVKRERESAKDSKKQVSGGRQPRRENEGGVGVIGVYLAGRNDGGIRRTGGIEIWEGGGMEV